MRSRTSILGTLIIVSFLVVCVAVILLLAIILGVRQRAEEKFGPPAAGISTAQQLVLSVQLLLQEDMLKQPADVSGSPRQFKIQLGEGTGSVINRLEAEGLISSADAFRNYLVYRGLDTTLQAGDYTLQPAMNAIEIALALQDATPGEVDLTIWPGWRLEEIAQSIPTTGLGISSQAFLVAAHQHPEGFAYTGSLPTHASLEGFLFPGSYRFRRDVPLDELLNAILDNFEAQMTPEIQDGFTNQNLDIYHGVTLASIVQREAVVAEEMPAIASVFLNRLAADMKLDSDPTVQYALGYNQDQGTWWTNPLSLVDLAVDSAYNTYLYPGLPPGPIANPGAEALRAVAYPAQTSYYYFRAACDGSGKHLFATNYAEHVANACP